MKVSAKGWFNLFKVAGTDWMNDRAPRLGAALAFYTIFSLAPLLTIVISIAALWFSDNASGQIFNQLGTVIGTDNALSLQKMLGENQGKEASGIWTTISAGVMLLVGATGVFIQLQDSLNEVWEVKLKPGQGIMGFIRHRLLSFAMVIGIAFILLVSLLLTAWIAAAGKFFTGFLGDTEWLFQVLNNIVTFGLVTLLFAMMFKYVPDVEIAWKDVWFGALFTAILFTIGKFALGMYLGKSSVVSTYSAAGSLLVVLLWVYYTSQIVFYGAELTQAYAQMSGRRVAPSTHAEKDDAKACQTQAAQADREVKKHKKRDPSPAPVYAMGAAMGPEVGTISSKTRPGHSRKVWVGLVLLAVVLYPVEKRLFRAKS